MREGELFGLRWRDVDIEGGALYVQTALKVQEEGGRALGRPKTEYSRRKIEFGEGTAEALRAHRKRQNEERLALGAAWVDHDLVFANTLGGGLAPNNKTRRHFVPAIKLSSALVCPSFTARHAPYCGHVDAPRRRSSEGRLGAPGPCKPRHYTPPLRARAARNAKGRCRRHGSAPWIVRLR